jgi:hypothetical protein
MSPSPGELPCYLVEAQVFLAPCKRFQDRSPQVGGSSLFWNYETAIALGSEQRMTNLRPQTGLAFTPTRTTATLQTQLEHCSGREGHWLKIDALGSAFQRMHVGYIGLSFA